MSDCGHQPINEDQLVVRDAGAHCPAPWSRRELILMPFLRQRANVPDQFSDHLRLSAGIREMGDWPAFGQWLQLLPIWFIQRCAP
ncbi:hypothetical protein [Streptomyces sp. NPDC048350]|uniref:hypothetical protein n=1 Tax=Streptomyces sp. NPDC048350 TaxID=3365538 RepID=UPI00371E300C